MSSAFYFDHAAATPLDRRVFEAMQPYLESRFYNPSATYSDAVTVRRELEAARGRVAHWLGARPSEIIFTAGGTEANNLALLGIIRQFPDCHVVATAIEHDSVLRPLAAATADSARCSLVVTTEQGVIEVDAIVAAVTDDTVLVTVGYANSEIGTVQSIRAIGQALAAIRDDRRQRGMQTPLFFHTDACQATNYLDLHAARLGVDLMTLNGGKIYGPKQSGVLYVRAGVQLEPLIYGGGQERGLRSGTENVAAAIGLAAAMDIVQSDRQEEGRRLQLLQKQFINKLQQSIPEVIINASLKHRLPNNIHVTLPGHDNERLLIQLDEAGIQAAAGSACSASDEEPSHVLKALGLSEAAAQSSLRFTMGRGTTEADITHVVETLASFLA